MFYYYKLLTIKGNAEQQLLRILQYNFSKYIFVINNLIVIIKKEYTCFKNKKLWW